LHLYIHNSSLKTVLTGNTFELNKLRQVYH